MSERNDAIAAEGLADRALRERVMHHPEHLSGPLSDHEVALSTSSLDSTEPGYTPGSVNPPGVFDVSACITIEGQEITC